MIRNVAGQTISAVVLDLDGAPVTSGVSATVTGDGGAQGAGAGTVTHEGGGEWSYAPTQAETNFTQVTFKFSAASAIPVLMQIYLLPPDWGWDVELVVPPVIVKPAAGTLNYSIRMHVKGPSGAMTNLDAAPTMSSLRNIANADLLARLVSATASLLSAGIYEWVYVADAAHATEGLDMEAFSVINGNTRNTFAGTVVQGIQSLEATTLAIQDSITDLFGLPVEDSVNDGAATATGFTVTTDVGTDVRVGMLRFTSSALEGESRLVSWTGTTVAVLSHSSMPDALKQFSAAPADAATFDFRPL